MRLHYKIAGGETIQYVYVMSLYPLVCKYFKFPIGHPTIHVRDACHEMQAMLLKDGLMKCSIMAPRHLYRPALPFLCNKRIKEKLFSLCWTYAIEQNRTEVCTHETFAERALTGT